MIVSLVGVTRTYHLDRQTVITPVRQVTLNVNQGEFILIVGRSGSGKTTLLNLAAGLIKPSSGDVRIDGINIQHIGDRQLSSLRSQKLGYIFQIPSLLPALDVVENVVMPVVFLPRNARDNARDKAASLLTTLGLGGRMHVYPRELSAGEQKRAAIARALINHPTLLLADEPTADLDEQTEQDIMKLLQQINGAGTTIVMVTHSMALTPYSTRTLKMQSGNLVSIT
jgi:ABC-type lipoprotein export system ATPase subunit